MEIKKLGTICKLKQGFQVPLPEQETEYKEGLVRFIRIVDYTQNTEDVRYVKHNEKYYYVEPDDVVMVRYGAAGEVGHGISGIIANNMFLIEPIIDINKNYLFYYLSQKKIKNKLLSTSTSTTMPALNFKIVNDLDIPIWDKDKQTELVDLFDKLSKIIADRKQELQLLDDLIKARFVELFVDKGYPLVALDDLAIGKGEYGAQSASVEYDPMRPRYVRITDINDDGTLNDDVVSSANVEDDEQYKLSYGDFMFARMGATVGKTYAYKTGNQIFAGYLIRYKLNLEKILPEYLYTYTKLDEYKNWVVLNQSGAAQPGINAKKYGSLQIPVAPLEKQREFSDFVKQTDKSKVEIQKSLEKLETLKKALMQEYFG